MIIAVLLVLFFSGLLMRAVGEEMDRAERLGDEARIEEEMLIWRAKVRLRRRREREIEREVRRRCRR